MEIITGVGQLRVEYGGDDRHWTDSVSQKTVTEGVEHILSLTGSGDTELSLGGLSTSTSTRFLRVQSSQHVKVRFTSADTTTQGVGWDVPAGGFVLGSVSNVTCLYVGNQTSTAATVKVVMYGYE